MAAGRLKIGRKVRLKPFRHKNCFYLAKPKIPDFNLEKHTPQQKNSLLFCGGVGGRPFNFKVWAV
jgi:hypothetical protein